MKKKIISLCLIVALALTAIGGATLAYFTDYGKQENNFTIGNISIKVDEWGHVRDKGGNNVPGTFTADANGITYSNLMPSYTIGKLPVVFNTCDNDAYVRVAVTINNQSEINDAIDGFYEEKFDEDGNRIYSDANIQAIYDKVFNGWGLVYTKDNPYAAYEDKDTETVRLWMNDEAHVPDNNAMTLVGTEAKGNATLYNIDMASKVGTGDDAYERYSPTNWMKGDGEKNRDNYCHDVCGEVSDGTLDGFTSPVYTYYTNALSGNDRVFVFYFKVPAHGDTGVLFKGLNVPAEFNNDQMKMFKDLHIGIYADAIQCTGFDNTPDGAKRAFETLEAEHPLGWWNE